MVDTISCGFPSSERRQRTDTFEKERFIFLHIPKCAGTSINMNTLGFHVGHLGYRHYEGLLGAALRDYFIFSIVRHPESRFRSAYRFLKAGGMNATDRKAGEKLASLNDTLRLVANNQVKFIHFRRQVDFLMSSRGNLMLNYVHRMEDDPENFFRVIRHYVGDFVADGVQRAMEPKNIRNASTAPKTSKAEDDLDLDLLREVYDADFWRFDYT
ncbi:MAG: sulfotransferase family 2 domain-containing protein [Thioclava marina]|uniref:sulfotransferase family 2 domain-containing protein n=1 Tax=Thioclava marina TaxID=1915077 RepID=UPI00198A93B3|nr:sulfotransferase family 2 domain-containing protein [Thioclava marina]MBC7146362.1 sulfotransferase family 2 domain-containing protein [Thioclava marina]